MEINNFLSEIGITKTKFAYAIAMKNASSLGRYVVMEDLLKIKRNRSKQALDILFGENFENEITLNEYVNEILVNKVEREKVLNKISKLIELNTRNEKLNELPQHERYKLIKQVFNLESIALQNNYLLDELDIFLKLINGSGGNELSILLKYLLKMNNKLEFSSYEKDNQKEVETMLFLALNNSERNKFIEKHTDLMDELFEKYESRVVARIELLNEQDS